MYITKLILQNFKSYINQEFEFKNITLLTGLNGAGKSSIFQAIRMISKEATLNSYGTVDTLKNINNKDNSFQIYIDTENSRNIGLKFELNSEDIEEFNINDINNLNISYIGANRFGPTEFQYMKNNNNDNFNVGVQGEYTLDILAKNDRETLPDFFKEANNLNTLKYHVEKWLHEISPNIKITTELNKRMNVASFTTQDGFTPLNIGFGVSYILSIIVQLLYSVILFEKQGIKTVILMENPEAHLHPKGQTKIAELIAIVANYGVQVIAETHSDYILDGLRLAVKDGKINHEYTKLYYLELDKEDNTEVKSPQIDSKGLLDKWPKNFFDTSINNKMRFI